MTSVQNVKLRTAKFLPSHTEDKHAEHFSGAWFSPGRIDHTHT